MTPDAHQDLGDVLALLAYCLQFSGLAAVSITAILLRRRQRGCWAFGNSGLLMLAAALWIALTLLDAGGMWNAIGNGLQDIPLIGSAKVALSGLIFWLLKGIMLRLSEQRRKE